MSISLKIMALGDGKSFKVESCMEYTVNQELSEYKEKTLLSQCINGETSKRM